MEDMWSLNNIQNTMPTTSSFGFREPLVERYPTLPVSQQDSWRKWYNNSNDSVLGANTTGLGFSNRDTFRGGVSPMPSMAPSMGKPMEQKTKSILRKQPAVPISTQNLFQGAQYVLNNAPNEIKANWDRLAVADKNRFQGTDYFGGAQTNYFR